MAYAQTQISSGPMWDPQVFARAVEHITAMSTRNGEGGMTYDPAAMLEGNCGRYSRGKHKGEIRGWMHIKYVSRGGWLKAGPGYMNGGVVRPDTILGLTVTDFNGKIYYEIGARI